MPEGFFWWRSCDSHDLDGTLDKNYLHITFTQFTDAPALMRGFAAHNRQTVKITSDFLFSSCNPYINHTKIDKCLLLFTTNKNIFTLLQLYRQLKTVGKNLPFDVTSFSLHFGSFHNRNSDFLADLCLNFSPSLSTD